MNFNLVAFRGFMFWVAIFGLFGNQLVFGVSALNELDAHNELVRHYHETEEQSKHPVQNRTGEPDYKGFASGLTDALGTSLLIMAQGDEIWSPDYVKIFANPAFPFQYVNEWNLFNHILAWGGAIAAFIWIVLRVSIKPDQNQQSALPPSMDSIAVLYKALSHPSFSEVKLTNTSTGETLVIDKVKGSRKIFAVMRFWFVPVLRLKYNVLGGIGVACIVLLFVFEAALSSPTPVQGFLACVYIGIGFIVALNIHKLSLYNHLNMGWEISHEIDNIQAP